MTPRKILFGLIILCGCIFPSFREIFLGLLAIVLGAVIFALLFGMIVLNRWDPWNDESVYDDIW